MNITVIGASAGVGLEATKRALQRGHRVTTLSRSEVPLPAEPNLISIRGSATDKSDLTEAIRAADAVLVALGTGKNMKVTTLFSDFARLLVEVQKETKTDVPFIFVTGFGTGESRKYVSWFVGIFLKYFLKDVYNDKTRMEEIVADSGMKWLFVRPGRLLDESLTRRLLFCTS